MKKAAKKSKAPKVKISGELMKLINTLSAIMVQSAVVSSTAQKAVIGKEFQRAYKIMSKALAEIYATSSMKKKQELKMLSSKLPGLIGDTVPCPGICCLGRPEVNNEADCVNPLLPGKPGIWVCIPNRINMPARP